MLRFATRNRALVLAACATLIAILYLWPFRLELSPAFHVNDARDTGSPPGVTFRHNGMLRTAQPPTGLYAALVGGRGLTIEAWVTTRSLDQSGPARIVTYSDGAASRNFTLAQEGDDLVFRLRTRGSDPNGTAGQASVPEVFVPGRAQHIVVSYDRRSLDVYVDGHRRARFDRPGGDLGTWEPGHQLAIGNELSGDRPWRGTVAAVALYDRPLGPDEALRAFEHGAPAAADPVVAYDFTRDPPAAGSAAAELDRPPVYLHGVFDGLLTRGERRPADFVLSFGAFAVFGGLVAHRLAGRGAGALLAAALLAGSAVLVLESLQFYVVGRTSSLRDLAAAVAGGLTGTVAAWSMRPAGARGTHTKR
jgi:Concanavalin A-like lectin/glucanases superfamily